MRSMNKTLRGLVLGASTLAMVLSPWSIPASAAATASSRPQIVIAIGNSQSMDGDLGGAIMTGSGQLSSSLSSLYNTSSPVNYSVPSGFVPPLTPAQTASAPYTYASGSLLYDNSASRLNVAKQGIGSVLNTYLGSMDFALEDYATSSPQYDTTLVYYMSPAGGGFNFASKLPANGFTSYSAYTDFVDNPANANASPAATRWVLNPCNGYTSASSDVNTYCGYIDATGSFPKGALKGSTYMQIGASSDDPDINDVLYASSANPLSLDYGGAYAAYYYSTNLGPITATQTPYTYFTLANYESGVVTVGYNSFTDPNSSITGPTNAGYVAYSPQVMYAQRGFGYNSNLSATGGKTVVGMTSNLDTLTPGSSTFNTTEAADLAKFTAALQPETNSLSTSEIKALAGQSATAGLVQGAGKILSGVQASCSGQYVILVTDGLPTMDLSGNAWPPLGSAAGNGYGVTAAFYGVGANSTYGIVDDSTNLPPGQKGALDIANTNDQALVDTITAIQALAKSGIKTYVIGLGAGVDATKNPAANLALNAMAIAGGTKTEYAANDVSTFNLALKSIASSIYGNVISAAPAVPGYVQNGSLAYVLASDNQNGSEQGLFEAFSTDSSGSVSSNAAWTLQMTAAQRQSALMTDSGNGTGVSLLANQSASAFGSPTSPTAQDIINYTIDPSYNGGQYLAGRASGSFLGTVTSQADKPLILSRPNNPYFIGSSSYRSFAQANAARQPLVLFTSNDGFLYAVSAGTSTTPGTLQWAWMPSVLLPQLQNYASFQTSQLMNGGFTTVDSADANGNWATYVVGTAESGALHYDLQLTACSSSTSACTPSITKVWFDQQVGAASPPQASPQAPQIWWDSNNVAYAYYFTTTGSGSAASTNLNVMRLYDGSTSQYALGFTPSSTSYVNASAGQLYVGDTSGNLWSLDLTAGTAKAVAASKQEIGSVPNAATAGAIRYIGEAQASGSIYLWATTDQQVSLFKFTGGAVSSTASTGWTPWWWSSTSGSGAVSITTSSNGTTTSTMVNTTSNPGVGATGAPYWLDPGSTITDASAVEASTLIVPVSISAADSCSASTAQYDFFDLATGTFPQKKFYDLNKNYLTANPVIGLGTAYSPVISQNGNGSALVYGTASQNASGNVGFQVAATSGLHVGPGVVGWQPVWITQP